MNLWTYDLRYRGVFGCRTLTRIQQVTMSLAWAAERPLFAGGAVMGERTWSVIVLLSVVAFGWARALAASPEPSRNINTYVLFAYDQMVLKGASEASGRGYVRGGNIGVNFAGRSITGVALAYATSGRVIMDAGTQAVADSVRADNPAGVFYDLFANSVGANFGATVLGQGPLPFTPPIIAPADLPALPFTPNRALTDNAADLVVGGSGLPSPYTFQPGAYRDVRINDGATAIFGAGTFDLRSLSTGANVTLQVADQTTIQIDRGWQANDGLRVGIGTRSGARILIGAYGLNPEAQQAVNFAHFAEIHAWIFAPTGWIDLGGDNQLFGRYWAQRITGDPNDNVTYERRGDESEDGEQRPLQCHEIHRPILDLNGVSLVDALATGTVTVWQAKRFCAPAEIGGDDPAALQSPVHQTYYTLRDVAPRFQPVANVTVTNRLGTHVVDLVKRDRLLVPTAKGLTEFPEELTTPVNHYACYRVRGSFRSRDLHQVADQFGTVALRVKRPLHVCLPAAKTLSGKEEEPVVDPTLSLACYAIRGRRMEARPAPFFTNNQFGPDVVEIFGPREICVRSEIVLP